MTSLIVDASVAVKWFIAEQDHEKALRLRNSELDLIAPELVLAEVGNALWKRFCRKMLSARDVGALAPLLHRPFHRLWPLGDLLVDASELAVEVRQPIYDCFYLALAKQSDGPLVTADAAQFEAARRAKIEARML
jgi:predicted nucleic acid-binding protein